MTAKLAANFMTALATLRERNETGATALEYAGMVLVAALVVGAVYTAVSGADVAGRMGTAISEILPG